MLTKCPECQLQISDKAITCPHCGYPLDAKVAARSRKSKARHRRLPNGFGRISEIKNRNLRKPFRAMVTVGFTDEGKPIGKLLKPQAFFSTYNEAYEALLEYHKNPYDLDEDITMAQLYEKWSDEYFKTCVPNSVRGVECAWRCATNIYKMRVKEVRARHLKAVLDETKSPSNAMRLKSIFNLMFDYALEYELTDRNYARTFKTSSSVIDEAAASKRDHISFSQEEMDKLWVNTSMQYVNIILIQCYMGWRPQELGLIRLENVDLVKWTIVGGMKTAAGTNRMVPIHEKIRPLVKAAYEEALELGSEYLLNCTDTSTHRSSLTLTYDKYQKRFIKIRDALHLNPLHRPHDPRKQFITMAKRAGCDEYAIKRMVGHAISDITESVYTDRDTDWLHVEIAKI